MLIRHYLLVILIVAGTCMPFTKVSAQNAALSTPRHIGGVTRAIAVADNIAYLGSGSELVVLDIRQPAQPRQVSSILLPYIIEDIVLNGRYAYLLGRSLEGQRLQVLEISNIYRPTLLSTSSPFGYDGSLRVSDGYAYLSGGKLWIFSLSNASAPQL